MRSGGGSAVLNPCRCPSRCACELVGKNNRLLDALPFSKVGRMVEMIADGVEADMNFRDGPTPESRRRVMMMAASSASGYPGQA